MNIKKYWDINRILEYSANWYVVFGQKSNGKTYGIIRYAIERYFKDGLPAVYLRRYKEELTEYNIQKVFQPHSELIFKLSDGKYNCIQYYRRRAYLAKIDGDKISRAKKPIFFTYALTTYEKENGGDIGETSLIFFDEFFTRENYLRDEMIKLYTCISNIVRDRTNTQIFLAGNTVNFHAPFFNEIGVNIKDLKQGYINEINFETGTKIVLEWCDSSNVTADTSNKLFGFSQKALKLTHTGEFTIDEYKKMTYEDIFEFNTQCKILFQFRCAGLSDIECYILTHKITSQPILFFRDIEEINSRFFATNHYDIIYRKHLTTDDFSEIDSLPNVIYNFYSIPKISQLIKSLLLQQRDYYTNNATGEYVKNIVKELFLK